MRAVVLAALVAAVPVSASDPTFTIGIACEGGLPMLIQIEASRPGVTQLSLAELMQFCQDARPQRQKWQGRT